MAASGMAVLPSLRIGSTLMGSQVIGVCEIKLLALIAACGTRGVYLGGGKDFLHGDSNLGANAVTLDDADGVVTLEEVSVYFMW